MAEHTPLPWYTKPTAGGHQHAISNESGKTIALVYTDADDAEFSVRAVNCHDELVRALDAACDCINGDRLDGDNVVEQSRAALAKANG